MIIDLNPVLQALLGTLLTWGLTAVGASLVFFMSSTNRKVLDSSLGFAAGVMTAASYWSLLAPAIEIAETSGTYGSEGEYAFIPAVVGFLTGAVFIFATDILLPSLGLHSPVMTLAAHSDRTVPDKVSLLMHESFQKSSLLQDVEFSGFTVIKNSTTDARRRAVRSSYTNGDDVAMNGHIPEESAEACRKRTSFIRILLLIIAITIHNIPEGLAVGVGFGAIGKTESATFENARNLAIGIGIQNFPEGLAVSLPLKGAGFSSWKSFWYGQLSGMVEPVAGLLGALLVSFAEPVLPYALAFAAGAMIYVVFDDIIPEAHACGNGRLCTWGAVIGFTVMMALDVGLG